jgi:cellulose synthase/poly-beta-1,6-N-acetylglucosamine synthase-like glycosyltransferase
MAVTVIAFLAYLRRTVLAQFVDSGRIDSSFLVETVVYVVLMGLLTFSALMYLLARQGSLHRSRQHARVPRAELDAHFAKVRPEVTVLVPSYKEDPAIVRMTLLSAALQEFPHMRVVLLIDDPTEPSDDDSRASLEACRALPREIGDLLSVPHERLTAVLEKHEVSGLVGGAGTPEDLRALAEEFHWAAAWLSVQALDHPRGSTQEVFVADQVLAALGDDLRSTGDALAAAAAADVEMSWERICQLARRLAWTFQAELTSFERKRYAQLSHEPNKAMNLNAYLALMGGAFREVPTRLGLTLRPTEQDADLVVPETELVLTLDADSVLLREYCLRLAYHLDLPGNERIAVIQTPYSAFRGATTRLERIAGATTDIQHELHQGMTNYDATFWVGANALIRKPALADIVEVTYVNGVAEHRYIQDRTVIEDTESSIDLVAHGWKLYNYGERLSYSATPPDFGSLAVQRGRWANGGLLILPSYWRHLRASRRSHRRVAPSSAALRVNYMASVAWASVGLVGLLLLPFTSRLLSPIIVAAALPYFLAMSSDLHRLGYKRTDVLRIYGFNLILLPVNLAGFLKSLQQAAAKSKLPFARTPKVKDRTATPALLVLSAVLIAAFSFWTLQRDIAAQNWGNASFAAFNGVLTTYAIVAFMGVRNAVTDVVLGTAAWIRVPVAQDVPPATALDPVDDWEDVLYFGPSSDGDVRRPSSTSAPMPRTGDTRARHRPDGAAQVPADRSPQDEVVR